MGRGGGRLGRYSSRGFRMRVALTFEIGIGCSAKSDPNVMLVLFRVA